MDTSVEMYASGVVLKVHGGTDREDDNLCTSCMNCHVFREAGTGERNVVCHSNYQHPFRMKGPVSQCNRYVDARKPTLQQMSEIAWQLMTNKSNKSLGFLSPDELRRRGPGEPAVQSPTPGFGF